MLSSKAYTKILFLILIAIMGTTIAYSYYFSKNYPPAITNRISFDAKLKFIRDHIDADKIDTLIVGSSLALNNVQGAYLEKASAVCKFVLNLSVYSVSVFQVEQMLELSDAFPNLKRIVYSAQFSDFPYSFKFEEYDPVFIKKYIRNELSQTENASSILSSCKNVAFCIKRELEWTRKHGQNNKFSYLGFDHTGSVPLHIYGKDIVLSRWKNPHPAVQNPKAYETVASIAQNAYKNGIKFYFIQQPYRKPLVEKYSHVRGVMESFAKNIGDIVRKNHGKFLNLHKMLDLNDDYFADRSHLNDKGSIIGSEAIAKFIDESEIK